MSSPQQRLSSIANQVSGSGGAAARQQLLSKNPDDVVCIPSEIVQEGEMKNVAKKDWNRWSHTLLEHLSPRPEKVV